MKQSIGMRRKRVLVILTIIFGMALPILWLGKVLADTTIQINDPLTVSEGGNGVIDETVLLADDNPSGPETIVTYTLVTTPAHGTLVLTNTATTLTQGAQFHQTDIYSGFLQYTHDGSETASDSFTFMVATSTTITGTFVISVTPFFDQTPVVNDQSFSVAENSTTGIPVGTIVATDLD
ncbi:MAG: hypothetical protein KC445_05930, partial [Anaerolineales bacterium]|nr:hypothetical protein [Anaerolineales bacterium]